MDIDLIADVNREHVEPLVQGLGQPFYIDMGAIQEAIWLCLEGYKSTVCVRGSTA